MLLLQEPLLGQKRGAKTANGDPHLVDAFRITRENGLLVAKNVGEAVSPDAL